MRFKASAVGKVELRIRHLPSNARRYKGREANGVKQDDCIVCVKLAHDTYDLLFNYGWPRDGMDVRIDFNGEYVKLHSLGNEATFYVIPRAELKKTKGWVSKRS